MKKRSCKMTGDEKAEHEFAVKVRKMTDKQLYEYVNEISEKNSVEGFIHRLETQSHTGIGPATLKKIKNFAVSEGFISEK